MPHGLNRSLVPVAAAIAACVAVVAVPLTLATQYHFLPFDDCLRHAAKTVSGKAWDQVLILRPEVRLDQHPGWHLFLSAIHKATGCDQAFLVIIEYLSLFVLAASAGLPWMRRKEAWIGALLLAELAMPEQFVFRLTRGRPYLLTEAALIALLFAWGGRCRRSWPLAAATTLLVALSAWVHGSWYLWILFVAAFFLAGDWRGGLAAAACWIGGSFLGACLTGRPIVYLRQQVLHAYWALGSGAAGRQLVGEFLPFNGAGLFLAALALLWLCRRMAAGPRSVTLLDRLALALGMIGWLGGFRVFRIWSEWGLPAMLVLAAVEFEAILASFWEERRIARLAAALLLTVGFYLQATADTNARWSSVIPDPHDSDQAGASGVGAGTGAVSEIVEWLPGPGGIVYSPNMGVFNFFFYQYPHADWRYVFGFEPGIMTDENRAVLRQIQSRPGDWSAFKPWVDAMRPEDRLIIMARARPDIPELDWKLLRLRYWIGRRPAR